jgi:YesN/AraC family two-component response regulator
MHVLIVDDEPHSQITLRSILAGRREVEGLDTARDAVEAFDKLMHRSFWISVCRRFPASNSWIN